MISKFNIDKESSITDEKFFKDNDIINKTIVTQGNKGCLFRFFTAAIVPHF